MLWIAAVAILALSACQPVDDPPRTGPSPVQEGTRRGAPDAQFPTTLPQVRDTFREAARSWQDAPQLVQLTVTVAPDGAWQRVRGTYAAGDADRLLLLEVDRETGVISEQRPTLETLGLQAVPSAAMQAVPPLPDAALEPGQLIESATGALQDCDAGPVDQVQYATGAPVAWDGGQWTEPPQWRASVLSTDGAVVVADILTGEVTEVRCPG